jgi:predicted HTH domain antitoxin
MSLAMKTSKLSLDEEIEILVKIGIHKNKADLLREALHLYREAHPDKKLEIAIELYREGKISLARAAEMAGTDLESFKAILASRKLRVQTALGSKTEIARARKQL